MLDIVCGPKETEASQLLLIFINLCAEHGSMNHENNWLANNAAKFEFTST